MEAAVMEAAAIELVATEMVAAEWRRRWRRWRREEAAVARSTAAMRPVVTHASHLAMCSRRRQFHLITGNSLACAEVCEVTDFG